MTRQLIAGLCPFALLLALACAPPGPTPSPLSPGIMVGNTLYLSGATGGDPATGQLVAGGLEPELGQILVEIMVTAVKIR